MALTVASRYGKPEELGFLENGYKVIVEFSRQVSLVLQRAEFPASPVNLV